MEKNDKQTDEKKVGFQVGRTWESGIGGGRRRQWYRRRGGRMTGAGQKSQEMSGRDGRKRKARRGGEENGN